MVGGGASACKDDGEETTETTTGTTATTGTSGSGGEGTGGGDAGTDGGECVRCQSYSQQGGTPCEGSLELYIAAMECVCKPEVCGGAGGDCQAWCSGMTPPKPEPCITCAQYSVLAECAAEWAPCKLDQSAGN
jgi:hypothetical protein